MNQIQTLQKDIKELVERINNKHNHPHPELISYMKVMEEMGEVTEVLLKNQIISRKGERESKEQIREDLGREIADVMIALISLANDFDIDLSQMITEKLNKHKNRLDDY